LDGSQHNVPPGGEQSGQVDGFIMDIAIKTSGAQSDVRLQCFGETSDIHVINSQLLAIPSTALILQ